MKPTSTILALALVALAGCVAPRPRYYGEPSTAPIGALVAPARASFPAPVAAPVPAAPPVAWLDEATVASLERCADRVLANAQEARAMWSQCRDSADCRALGRFLESYAVPDYDKCRRFANWAAYYYRTPPRFQHRIVRATARVDATNEIHNALDAEITAKAGRLAAEGN